MCCGYKNSFSKKICLDNLKLNVDANLTYVKFVALDKFNLKGAFALNIHDYLLSINGNPLINDNKSYLKVQKLRLHL